MGFFCLTCLSGGTTVTCSPYDPTWRSGVEGNPSYALTLLVGGVVGRKFYKESARGGFFLFGESCDLFGCWGKHLRYHSFFFRRKGAKNKVGCDGAGVGLGSNTKEQARYLFGVEAFMN